MHAIPVVPLESRRSPALRPAALAFLLSAGMLAPLSPSGAAKLAFVTSTSGVGILGQWPDAGGATGLAAGDAICVARATAANLPEPQSFVAWLSDSSDDAYCRVHGFSGKKSAQCGQQSLPTGAGPWQRTDGAPFMGALTSAAPAAAVYVPLARDEFGQAAGSAAVFTGTYADGDVSELTCGNWLANSEADIGVTNYTYPGWSQYLGYMLCDFPARLACLQKGPGDPLPTLPRAHKLAFLTSLSLGGNLGAASQAGGSTGVAAGDAICRNLAQTANLPDAASYKAYLTDGTTHPADRFQHDGPWQRPDGAKFADSFAQIRSGFVHAPLNITETGAYASNQSQLVWTGMDTSGRVGTLTCNTWSTTSATAWISKLDAVGPSWPPALAQPASCLGLNRLYCLSDSDQLFRYGFD